MKRLVLIILILMAATACTKAGQSGTPPGGAQSGQATTTTSADFPGDPAQTTRESVAPGIRITTLAATADCEGKSVKVMRTEETPVASGSPARLQVVGDDDHVWLDVWEPGGVSEAWFARACAPSSLLVLRSGDSPNSRLRAYRCSAGEEQMKPIAWDGLSGISVRTAEGDDQEIRVVLADWHGQELPTAFRYQDGGLAGRIPGEHRARLSATSGLQLEPGLRIIMRMLPDPQGALGGGPMLVQDEGGRVLLEMIQGAGRVEGVRTVGDSVPLLVVAIPGGGSMGEFYTAYRYDRSRGRLVRVPWTDQASIASTSGVQQAGDMLRTTGRADSPGGWRRTTNLWEYRDGLLQRFAQTVESPPNPFADERTVLLMAFDASFRRLANEVDRYFVDAGLARQVYADLTSKTPVDGHVYCGTACEPGAGPVLIWWVPEPPVKAPPILFRAESAFQGTEHGPRVAALTFSQVRLAVFDATTARQVLQQRTELRTLDVPEPIFQGEVWTTMVPGAGFWRVDPLTGSASRDT